MHTKTVRNYVYNFTKPILRVSTCISTAVGLYEISNGILDEYTELSMFLEFYAV